MDKFKLLRRVIANLHVEPAVTGVVTQDHIDQSRFARARLGPTGTVGVLRRGGEAFSDLSDAIFRGQPQYLRGCYFRELSGELFTILITSFLGRNEHEVTPKHLADIELKIQDWYVSKSSSHHLYVPCSLTPWPAASFVIGPVRFTHVAEFLARVQNEPMFEETWGMMLRQMQSQRAYWIAEVDIDHCMQNRGQELGELAIDIAIIGLQLLVGPDTSRHMARLTARTRPAYRFDVSVSNGIVSPSVTNQEPGLTLGPGALEQVISKGNPLLSAVAPQVEAFLARGGSLPTLSRAWADAAYWYHEGLAEPLDTIALSKLETSIEVLLRSESSKGSEARVRQAIRVFYGLGPEQLINPHSDTTVKQFAKALVQDRSMVLHGTWSTLVHAMRTSRASVEALVAGLLTGYVLELQAYSITPAPTDAIEPYLEFLESRRPKS